MGKVCRGGRVRREVRQKFVNLVQTKSSWRSLSEFM